MDLHKTAEALQIIDRLLSHETTTTVSLSYEACYRFFYDYTLRGGVYTPIRSHVEDVVVEGYLIPKTALVLLRGGDVDEELRESKRRWTLLCDVMLYPIRTRRFRLDSWEQVMEKIMIPAKRLMGVMRDLEHQGRLPVDVWTEIYGYL